MLRLHFPPMTRNFQLIFIPQIFPHPTIPKKELKRLFAKCSNYQNMGKVVLCLRVGFFFPTTVLLHLWLLLCWVQACFTENLVTLSVNRSERQFWSYKLQVDFMLSRAWSHLSFPVFTNDNCTLVLYSWAFETLRWQKDISLALYRSYDCFTVYNHLKVHRFSKIKTRFPFQL